MSICLVEKTHDVKCNRNILDNLGAEFLLFSNEYNLIDYLTCDIDLLRRRSKNFFNTDKIERLYDLIDDTVTSLSHIAQIVKLQSGFGDSERGLYSVKQLNLYFETIERLNEFYAKYKARFTSEDYISMFDKIHELASSDEYAKMKNGTQHIIEKITHIKSVLVGFNLDASLSPLHSRRMSRG